MAYAYLKKAAVAWLKDNKKTQNWLALSIDATDGTVSRYLDGSRDIPFEKQVKIAQACGHDYLSFLQYGKSLLEEGTENRIVPTIKKDLPSGLPQKKKYREPISYNPQPDIPIDILKRIQTIEEQLKISLQEPTIIDYKDPIKAKHHELIDEFPDAEKGLKLNALVIKLGKHEPEEIDRVIRYLEERIVYRDNPEGSTNIVAISENDILRTEIKKLKIELKEQKETYDILKRVLFRAEMIMDLFRAQIRKLGGVLPEDVDQKEFEKLFMKTNDEKLKG